MLEHLQRFLRGHALAFTQLAQFSDHFVHFRIVIRVNDGCATDIVASFFRSGLDLIGVADQNGLQEITSQQTGSGFQNTGIGTFGKDDFLGIRLQTIDHFTKKHIHSS